MQAMTGGDDKLGRRKKWKKRHEPQPTHLRMKEKRIGNEGDVISIHVGIRVDAFSAEITRSHIRVEARM